MEVTGFGWLWMSELYSEGLGKSEISREGFVTAGGPEFGPVGRQEADPLAEL